MEITLFPERHAVVAYADQNDDLFEGVLWYFRSGTYATHYVGPLWNIADGAESLLGLRWVRGDAKPVRLQCEVINKVHIGSGESKFPGVGTKNDMLLYFRDGALKFSGMWLEEVPRNAESLARLMEQLKVRP